MIEYLPIVLLIAMIIIGVPIAWSLFVSSFFGLVLIIGYNPTHPLLQIVLYSGAQAYVFSTIPMFLLMANLLSESGLTSDVFSAINEWVGHIPGGLAIATTIANGGFAALSGSSTAAAAALSKIAVPEMKSYDYEEELAIGTVAASGTFAMMIPPSIAFIIYGVTVQQSVGDLFIAGIIPGILTVLSYITLISIMVRYKPSMAPSSAEKSSLGSRIKSLKPIWPAVTLIILVLGGIYGGLVTPTEAGGLGAAGALVIGLAIYNLSISKVIKASKETCRTTAMIFMILLGTKLFSRYLSVTGIADEVINGVGSLPINRWSILVIVLLIYILLGMFMDQTSVLLLTLPITYPLIVTELGFNPIWFGVLIVKSAEVGMITPPLGLNVYVATSAVDIDVDTAFKGATRFLVAETFVIIALMLLPNLATWLPQTMS